MRQFYLYASSGARSHRVLSRPRRWLSPGTHVYLLHRLRRRESGLATTTMPPKRNADDLLKHVVDRLRPLWRRDCVPTLSRQGRPALASRPRESLAPLRDERAEFSCGAPAAAEQAKTPCKHPDVERLPTEEQLRGSDWILDRAQKTWTRRPCERSIGIGQSSGRLLHEPQASDTFMIAMQAQEPRRLELDDLRRLLARLRSDFPSLAIDAYRYGLALDTLAALLGEAGIRNRFRLVTENRFLHDRSPGEIAEQARVERLATALYELQAVAGYQERLRSVAATVLESAYGEMTAAASLARAGLLHSFILPTGKPRANFDFQLSVGNTLVACEAKTKLASTSISAETILTALEKARGQLPEDRPGVIWLTIPPDWASSGLKDMNVEAAMAKFNARETAVFSVTIAWEAFNGLALGALNDVLLVPQSRGHIELYEEYASTLAANLAFGTPFDDLIRSERGAIDG